MPILHQAARTLSLAISIIHRSVADGMGTSHRSRQLFSSFAAHNIDICFHLFCGYSLFSSLIVIIFEAGPDDMGTSFTGKPQLSFNSISMVNVPYLRGMATDTSIRVYGGICRLLRLNLHRGIAARFSKGGSHTLNNFLSQR